jgi:hypothetical protein
LQSFSNYKHASKKNGNGKTTTGFFRNVFYEFIKGKLSICLLLTMSIGNDWMIDMMIIFVGKTIAKALDINDIILSFFKGDVNSMSPNLSTNNQI